MYHQNHNIVKKILKLLPTKVFVLSFLDTYNPVESYIIVGTFSSKDTALHYLTSCFVERIYIFSIGLLGFRNNIYGLASYLHLNIYDIENYDEHELLIFWDRIRHIIMTECAQCRKNIKFYYDDDGNEEYAPELCDQCGNTTTYKQVFNLIKKYISENMDEENMDEENRFVWRGNFDNDEIYRITKCTLNI